MHFSRVSMGGFCLRAQGYHGVILRAENCQFWPNFAPQQPPISITYWFLLIIQTKTSPYRHIHASIYRHLFLTYGWLAADSPLISMSNVSICLADPRVSGYLLPLKRQSVPRLERRSGSAHDIHFSGDKNVSIFSILSLKKFFQWFSSMICQLSGAFGRTNRWKGQRIHFKGI